MMDTTYYILQHIPNRFRHEAFNVGLILQRGKALRARFMGELPSGEFSKAHLKSFLNAGVYEQWVEYWRYELQTPETAIQEIEKAAIGDYRLLKAGSVEVSNETLPQMLKRLYKLIVESKVEKPAKPKVLLKAVASALKDRHILNQSPHPVVTGRVINAGGVPYTPDFVQENGTLYVMQTVDGRLSKTRIGERSGASALMFREVRSTVGDSKPVKAISILDNFEANEEMKRARKILERDSDVVIWSNPKERRKFLEQREAVAL